MRARTRQALLACSLSAVGLGYAAVLVLSGPRSRVGAWIDRNLLPAGVTW